ncbi:hypothetical protein PMIN01_02624 [Paraphaeosphaeria minitans]|uniref:Uncharacterized protein n=1 Tax=Paraphaeosphaeria minitans TaxID=565426 RepID=A0A9P6KVL3_9PLEO|nr:hypothetical protein PMIN01_02624 [Paraphaeosphaeria minitans]
MRRRHTCLPVGIACNRTALRRPFRSSHSHNVCQPTPADRTSVCLRGYEATRLRGYEATRLRAPCMECRLRVLAKRIWSAKGLLPESPHCWHAGSSRLEPAPQLMARIVDKQRAAGSGQTAQPADPPFVWVER